MADKKLGHVLSDGYERFVSEVQRLIEEARRQASRSVNAVLTASYWELGRRIVEQELHGRKRAGYGEALLVNLSRDLEPILKPLSDAEIAALVEPRRGATSEHTDQGM